jgi:hypothetical protein
MLNSKDLVIYFKKMWRMKYGYPYPAPTSTKQMSMIKQLLNSGYTDDQIYELMHYYIFEYNDSFAVTVGKTLECFRKQVPRIVSEFMKVKKKFKEHPDYDKILEARKKNNE